MTCPMCNGETKITSTRESETDYVRRFRKCRSCGYHFATIETDEDIYIRLNKKKEDTDNG